MGNRNARPRSSSDKGTRPDEDDPVAGLRDAAADLRAVRADARETNVTDPGAVADAYRDVEAVLDKYEDRATDWDDLEGYVEFREALSEQLARLADDLAYREAFDEADDTLTTSPQRVLSAKDFRRARDQLAPARELADLRERRRTVRERYRDARHAVSRRRDDLRDRRADLEHVRDLGEADLDAPVDQLRDPIQAYNDRVRDAFEAFKREASARAALEFVDVTSAYPLVAYRQPPDRLRAFVTEAEAGEKSVATLLEYANYSTSKLSHFVDDPQAVRAAVATNQTYLQRLNADPVTVEWPPPPADHLRWRGRELVAVVARFADEEAVALARTVRQLAERDDYARLRESAVARVELDDAERHRLQTGAVERDLREVRERIARLDDALDEHPRLDAFDDPWT